MTKGSNALTNLHSYNVDIKEREIYFHSYIDEHEESGVDHKTYGVFHKNLRLLDSINHNPIIVHINSPGGAWSHGLAIFDAIKLTESKTIGIAYGDVSSSASVILQAFKLRLVTKHTVMVIHHGGSFAAGTSTYLLALAENEKRQREIMLRLYAERNTAIKYKNKPIKEIMDDINDRILKKEDVYLIGREIVDEGFADAVIGDEGFADYACLKN